MPAGPPPAIQHWTDIASGIISQSLDGNGLLSSDSRRLVLSLFEEHTVDRLLQIMAQVLSEIMFVNTLLGQMRLPASFRRELLSWLKERKLNAGIDEAGKTLS